MTGGSTCVTDRAATFDDSDSNEPAVVLIHGVGLSHAMWSAQVAALSDRYRVLSVDLPGHGDVPPLPASATLEDYAAHVTDTLDRAGIAQAVLIGFSMGALVARAIAIVAPDRVTGLVLLNGVFDRAPDVRATILARVEDVEREGPVANIDAAIERWFSPAFRHDNAAYVAALRARFVSNDADGYARSYRLFATEDNFGADRLGAIGVPVLVATGEHDVGSTPEMATALAAKIPGAAVRIVEGARHMMPVEMPAQTNALLLEFLDKHARRSRASGDDR